MADDLNTLNLPSPGLYKRKVIDHPDMAQAYGNNKDTKQPLPGYPFARTTDPDLEEFVIVETVGVDGKDRNLVGRKWHEGEWKRWSTSFKIWQNSGYELVTEHIVVMEGGYADPTQG
jgi:hypothetical protein